MLQDADANNSLDQNLPHGINNSHRESARPNDYMNSQASLQHCISSYHVYFYTLARTHERTHAHTHTLSLPNYLSDRGGVMLYFYIKAATL